MSEQVHEITYNPAYEDLFNDRKFLNFLYGGAGSGKSVFTAQREIIRLLEKKEKLVCVRKVKDTIKDSQFAELCDVISNAKLDDLFHITKSPMEIKCKHNGSMVIFRGLDDVNKLKSVSRPTRFWVEEANEINKEDLMQILLRIRGQEKKGAQYTFTFNPDIDQLHWISKDYLSKGENKNVTIRHFTYKSNKFATEEDAEFYESLKDSEPNFYKVYVLGEMANLDKPDQVIKYEWVDKAKARKTEGGEICIGADIARFGDDKTKFGYLRGDNFYRIDTYSKQSITDSARRLIEIINDEGAKAGNVGIDTVGIGAGVYDYLKDEGYNCTEIQSGERASENWKTVYQFKNLRSQMWWYAREQLRLGNVSITVFNSQRLLEDLTAPTYRIRSKVIEVESKEDIKKRIGRSTDDGDCFVYALFVKKLKKETFGIWM